MQSRLDRIDALIKEGHTLEKKWGYYPDLKTSSGKSVNIFGPLFRLSGPAGFSWIAFFFPWAVCAQIREWSYFYFVCIFSLVETAVSIVFNSSGTFTEFIASFFYASMYPYLRYLAAKRGVEEISKGSSIAIGFSLVVLALVPSFILAVVSAAFESY